METTVEALEGNKVRLHVAVPAVEFERAIDAAFRKLAGEVRIPGFRPGKAPRRLLEARFGAQGAREQALQDSLADYYGTAVIENDVDAIAPPEIDITAGREEGDVEFDAVVEVRPVVNLVGYDSLRVELPWKPVDEEAVDAQIDSMRERFSELVDSEDPLTDGDFATIDIRGSIGDEEVEGLVATDFLYRVGSGIVVPGLDDQIRGTRPGAILQFAEELPERFADRAGIEVTFKVLVKEAKQRKLPELTDEWVAEASELATVEELRTDARRRLDIVSRVQAQMALRERVLEAAAELVPVEAPEVLVRQETERRLHDLLHRLDDQKMNIGDYLAATGREEQDLVDEVQGGAAHAVLADLALRAVVAQEAIEATGEELDAEVFRLAERMQEKPERVRRDLEKRGVVEAVRSDIARGKALEFLISHAEVVDESGEPIDLTLPELPDADAARGSDESAEESSPDDTEERREA